MSRISKKENIVILLEMFLAGETFDYEDRTYGMDEEHNIIILCRKFSFKSHTEEDIWLKTDLALSDIFKMAETLTEEDTVVHSANLALRALASDSIKRRQTFWQQQALLDD